MLQVLKSLIKKIVPKENLYTYQIAKTRDREYKLWLNNGKPIPAPDNVKYKLVDIYRKRYRPKNLVETGTFYGGMIRSHVQNFSVLHTIELKEEYYTKAVDRFKNFRNVHCHFGESVDKLRDIVPKLKGRTLYWLDAHYSVDVFARGRSDCPALEELEIIFKSDKDPIILIDDARDFTGEGDYPTVDDVFKFIKEKRPEYYFRVENDIIIAAPNN